MRGAREGAHERTEVLPHHRAVVDVGDETVVLVLVRQFAVTQQPSDFKEVGLLAQLLDRIATIAQNRVLAVDVRDFRFALRGGEETGVECDPAIIAQRGHHDASAPAVASTTGRVKSLDSTLRLAVAILVRSLPVQKVPPTIWHARFDMWVPSQNGHEKTGCA